MMKKLFILLLLLVISFSSYSQNPAKFKDGIELKPINAPSTPNFGTVYFDTAQNIFFGWDGTDWLNLGVKNTSQLINDGENGIHPFITESEVINSVAELTDVSAVWTGTGLSFDVIADRYPVNLTWETSLADEITLDASHATLDRIDLIIAIAPLSQGVGQNGSVGFITGTPASANLVVPPDFNPALVYPIKFVLVEAASSIPENTSTEIIYDENVGIPTEWDFTSNTGSIVNSTNDPHSGTNSIEGTNTTYGATMTSTRSVSINTALIDSFDFWIKLKESIGNEYFLFQFFNTNSTSIGTYQLNKDRLEIPESLDWQRVVIPMTDLELPITDLLSITIKPYIGGFDGFFFDEFKANLGQGSTGGSDNITNTSQLINDGEDGINPFITELSSKNYSWGESYINNWRDLVLDDGAIYFPNNGGYEKGRLHQAEINPSLHFIPAAVGEGVIYAIGKNRINDLTVERAGVATYRSEDDIIQTASIDFARIDYTDGDGAFLFEPQSINLYLNMEVMVTQDVTVTASEYTVSFYGTGTITFTGTHTGSLVGTGLNDLVSITFTPSAGTLTSTISGAVTEGQIELGKYASSRIITAGTTVTRLADVITGAGDVNTFNSEEGVLYVEMAALSDDGTSRRLSISDGTTANRINFIYDTGSNTFKTFFIVNGAVQVSTTTILSDITNFSKFTFKWKENDFALWIDDIEVATDNSGIVFPVNTLTTLSFDIGGGGSSFYGKVRQLKVYKSISDAQLDFPYITNFFPLLLIGFRRRNQYKIAA